ncbi:hypothetical protein ACFV19_29375, partial [Streptomyces griseoluteus]
MELLDRGAFGWVARARQAVAVQGAVAVAEVGERSAEPAVAVQVGEPGGGGSFRRRSTRTSARTGGGAELSRSRNSAWRAQLARPSLPNAEQFIQSGVLDTVKGTLTRRDLLLQVGPCSACQRKTWKYGHGGSPPVPMVPGTGPEAVGSARAPPQHPPLNPPIRQWRQAEPWDKLLDVVSFGVLGRLHRVVMVERMVPDELWELFQR